MEEDKFLQMAALVCQIFGSEVVQGCPEGVLSGACRRVSLRGAGQTYPTVYLFYVTAYTHS